jgi:guanylate kinase
VYNRSYGTLRQPVVDAIERGRSILLDVDVQGGRQVKERCPDCTRICLLPPEIGVLEERLRARGDAEETLSRRMAQVHQQLEAAEEYDFVVVNDDLETACAVFEGIFLAELSRSERRRRAIARILGRER